MKERVEFQDIQKNKVVGILSNPADSVNAPIVILVHGLASHKESRTYIALEERLNEEGIATLRIDLYGHGESDGNFQDLTITHAVDSISAAIRFLKEKGYQELGLLGSSFGGISSLVAASQTQDLALLVLQSSVGNYIELEKEKKTEKELEEWKKQGYLIIPSDEAPRKLGYCMFEDAKKYNGYALAKEIQIPTLVIHGDMDDIVPLSQGEKLYENLPQGKLYVIKGADHRFQDPEMFSERLNVATQFILNTFKKHG